MFRAGAAMLLLCFGCVVLRGPGAAAASSAAPAVAPPDVSVVVDTAFLGPEVPRDFLGLSFETVLLSENEFTPGHPVLARLLQNMGPGVLRFGGNSQDRSAWGPAGTFAGALSTVAPDDLARMFSFARQIGWRVLLGLNLGHYDPAAAADEADTAARLGGPTLEALEFGNEPDLYVRARPGIPSLRPASYGIVEYLREWQSYLAALRARVPHASIVGPDTAGTPAGTELLRQFVAVYGPDVAYATAHHYPLGATITNIKSPRYASIANLLSPGLLADEGAAIGGWVKVAARSGRGLRLGETNSVFGGGKNGVSDVFAGALWTADYLFRVAQLGVIGVNLHGTLDRCGGYSPICASSRALAQTDDIRVQPNYYAMLLFHHAARGRFASVRVEGSRYVTAYATLDGDRAVHVTLINLGPAPATARIAVPGRFRMGSVMRLAGAALESSSEVTLAGSAVGPDGRWSPKVPESVAVDGDTVDLTLPATSAAAVTLTPAVQPEPHARTDNAPASAGVTPRLR
jgi:hypothetical protein